MLVLHIRDDGHCIMEATAEESTDTFGNPYTLLTGTGKDPIELNFHTHADLYKLVDELLGEDMRSCGVFRGGSSINFALTEEQAEAIIAQSDKNTALQKAREKQEKIDRCNRIIREYEAQGVKPKTYEEAQKIVTKWQRCNDSEYRPDILWEELYEQAKTDLVALEA